MVAACLGDFLVIGHNFYSKPTVRASCWPLAIQHWVYTILRGTNNEKGYIGQQTDYNTNTVVVQHITLQELTLGTENVNLAHFSQFTEAYAGAALGKSTTTAVESCSTYFVRLSFCSFKI